MYSDSIGAKVPLTATTASRLLMSAVTGADKSNAAAALVNVTVTPDDKVTAASIGVIPVLAAMIASADTTAQAHAAACIMNLCDENEDNVNAAAATAGIFASLVQILRSGTPVGKENAAGALADNAANQISIAAAGAIPVLCEMAKSGDAMAKQFATGTLANLARNAANQASIVGLNTIPELIEIAKSGTWSAKLNAEGVLRELSANAKVKAAIVSAGGAKYL
jgi:hypothetical protein